LLSSKISSAANGAENRNWMMEALTWKAHLPLVESDKDQAAVMATKLG